MNLEYAGFRLFSEDQWYVWLTIIVSTFIVGIGFGLPVRYMLRERHFEEFKKKYGGRLTRQLIWTLRDFPASRIVIRRSGDDYKSLEILVEATPSHTGVAGSASVPIDDLESVTAPDLVFADLVRSARGHTERNMQRHLHQ